MTEQFCDCGGELKTPTELNINPDTVFNDSGWAWQGKDIDSICSQCGAHYFKDEINKEGENEMENSKDVVFIGTGRRYEAQILAIVLFRQVGTNVVQVSKAWLF